MHLVQIIFHLEFSEEIETILDERQIEHFVRFPAAWGKDRDGKHYGNQAFPGSMSIVQVMIRDENIDELLECLKEFRAMGQAHRHLEALVLPVARRL